MPLLTADEVVALNFCDKEMSNFDCVIDDGMEDALRTGGCYGKHSAWNFNGDVWFQDGQFHEWIWVYGSPRALVSASTLRELMQKANWRYGSQ